MMKRHIIFDAGGVLFYINEFRNDIIRRVMSSQGYQDEIIEYGITQLKNHDSEYFKKYEIVTWTDEKKWLISRANYLCSTMNTDNDELKDKIFMLTLDTFQYHLYDETIDVLEKLIVEHRLYVLSNSTASLDWAFDLLGIRKYFKDVIISSYTGLVKPDEKIYKFALKQIGQEAEHCIFIDDRMENVLASRNCGIESFHLIRDNGMTLNDFVIYLEKKSGIGI